MKTYQNSPVKEVTFGEANHISLNHYYDILKANAGSLAANELLQLKATADIVDITEKKNVDGGYEWFSHYNMLNRADVQLETDPVSGDSVVALAKFSEIYGKFLNKLSRLVLIKELSPEDSKRKNDLEVEIGAISAQLGTLSDSDYVRWKQYCELRNINVSDVARYNQWAELFGNSKKIQQLIDLRTEKDFEVIQIIDRKYEDADDQEIVNAYVKYRSNAMKMCFPTLSDYEFSPINITMQYLLSLLPTDTGQFDYRYFYSFSMDPMVIKSSGAGAISASFNRNTAESSSIKTDWSAKGSGGFSFIRVKTSASEHTEISEDFKKATGITLASKSALRVNIRPGAWFNANLFRSKYIKANPVLFMEFFGKNGSLLLYPTALILVRGFSVEFTSSQSWKYDYVRNFSAKGKGGFGAFGIRIGAGVSYSKNMQEHKIDQTGTTLKISDDEKTIRFVGYAVMKNDVLSDDVEDDFLMAHKMK